jgi:cytochrome c biogenesis protein CcdA
MRTSLGCIAAVCALVGAVEIARLHGYERALGRDDWQYRSALIEAYSDEVVFRAGPCVLAALAALLSIRGRRGGLRSVAVLVVAVVSVAGTYLTIRLYIVTPPGQFMPTTVWDGISGLAWIASVVLVWVGRVPDVSSEAEFQVRPQKSENA